MKATSDYLNRPTRTLEEYEAKHTPGPWKPVPYSSVVGAGVMAQPDPKENSVTVAMCPGPDCTTAEANARLIASCPDLLAACQQALAMLENMRSDDFRAGADKPERDLLEAVIAKATK